MIAGRRIRYIPKLHLSEDWVVRSSRQSCVLSFRKSVCIAAKISVDTMYRHFLNKLYIALLTEHKEKKPEHVSVQNSTFDRQGEKRVDKHWCERLR